MAGSFLALMLVGQCSSGTCPSSVGQRPQVVYPQAQAVYPQAQAVYPQAQAVYPQAQAVYPQALYSQTAYARPLRRGLFKRGGCK